MKKIMAVLTVFMCFASTNVFAQLKEVRGVQTRMVEYQSDHKAHDVDYSRHGFEFKNENNYAVWVEAELLRYPYEYSEGYNYKKVEEGICDTKSFTLSPGETYVWKCGDRMFSASPGLFNSSCHKIFYVKYKAYKAE